MKNNILEEIKLIGKIGKNTDFSDLTPINIKSIIHSIDIVNDFNSKIRKYGEHIFKSEFLDTIEGWEERLSEKDFNNLFPEGYNKKNRYKRYVLCYKKMMLYSYGGTTGWSMGYSSSVKTDYELIEDKLYVIDTWSTQSARFDHIPLINRKRIFTVDYKTKEVVLSGDDINIQ